jgi:ribosomal protein L44E
LAENDRLRQTQPGGNDNRPIQTFNWIDAAGQSETMAGPTKPTFSDPDAWWGHDAKPLPTPRTMLTAERLRLAVSCDRCGHERDADLQALIDGGRGDVSWNRLRFRCSVCGSRQTTVEIRGARRSPGIVGR